MSNLDKILPALFKAQGELNHVGKNADNPFFSSKYADLPAVIDFIKPVLQANGLLYTHLQRVRDGQQILETYVYHAESGQHLMGETLLQPTKKDPQGFGSAITYARRYDLCAILGLAQADDDGNAASKPMTAKEAKERAQEIGSMLEHAEDIKDLARLWKTHQAELKRLGDAHLLFGEQIKDDMKTKLGE